MLKLNVLYNAVYLSRSIRPNKYPKIEFEIESKVRHSLLYIPLPFERQIQTSLRTWLCVLGSHLLFFRLLLHLFTLDNRVRSARLRCILAWFWPLVLLKWVPRSILYSWSGRGGTPRPGTSKDRHRSRSCGKKKKADESLPTLVWIFPPIHHRLCFDFRHFSVRF